MNFTIKRKLMSLTVLGISLVTIIGGTGYWGVRQLDSAMDDIVTSAAILRNHMTADMMHDA